MDSSQFLPYFWSLTDEHSNEQIVNAAEAIVNLVVTKQKLENDGREFNRDKFKLYLNICENSTEDILYTTKRLIGGIASTGVESRRGFVLTFSLLIEKFSNILNFQEIVQIIEKETIVSKGEKNYVKNCAMTGKVLMLRTLLGLRSLTADIILSIFKILFDLIEVKILEEAILQILNNFFTKLKDNFYTELTEKKLNRFFDKFLNLLNKILVNKSTFGNLKTLYEFSLIFILLSHSDVSQSINNFLHQSTSQNILTENSLSNYFRLLIVNNIRDNEFHSSFKFLLSYLTKLNDFPKVIEVWNVLIDENVQEILKALSSKNFQFLIYSFSKFLLEKFFTLKYVKQIFDSSYFDNLMKFSSNKKFKYIGSLVEILMSKMKTIEESERELSSSYSFDLLKIFRNENGLSPQSYKNFYAFLFNNLEESLKQTYVESLIVSNDTDETENEDLMFRVAALKQLMASANTSMAKSLKLKIVEFFLKEYYSEEPREDVEVEDLIEDRLLQVVFSYMRVPKEETEEDTAKPLKDTKMIKLLMQIHKFLQSLHTGNALEGIQMEDYKVYLKYYKKFALLATNIIKNEEEKPKNDKLFSIVKIAMVSLILYLKHPRDYSDVITDLYAVSGFKKDWQKVYMDLLISLLHKGNNALSEFILNCFRKVSKYLDMESFEVLLGFLSLTQREKTDDFEDFEDEVEENLDEEKKELKSKKKNKKGSKVNGMFNDLTAATNDDVEMTSIY